MENYINILYDDLSLECVPKNYLPIYQIDKESILSSKQKIGWLFAYWHYNINIQFEKINSYIKKGYNYFHAAESREVLHLMTSTLSFIEKFKKTPYEFTFDIDYLMLFNECKIFLNNIGSPIPEEFGIINLAYRPIFIYTNQYYKKESRDYKLKLIGEGAYANVFKYNDAEYNCKFALKKLKDGSTAKDCIRFEREYTLMKQYQYPYITKVYGYNSVNQSYTMELCSYNLDKFINTNNTKLAFNQRKSLAIQVLKGLSFLHSKGVLHRDLSYRNILIQSFDDLYIVKISDFGLAKDDKESITNSDSSIKGTITDPCLDSFKNYDVKNEIYAVGFILWFIFTGRKNFKSDNTAIANIISKCITINKEERYVDIETLSADIYLIKKLSDKPISKVSLKQLKNKIIEALYDISAYELPEACVSIGLREGNSDEAFRSKRQYVSKRLYGFDESCCLELISSIKRIIGLEIDIYDLAK